MRRLLTLFSVPFCLLSQAPNQACLDQLVRFPGPKVVLIGTWSPTERQAWERILLEEGIFETGLTLLDSARWSEPFLGSPDPGGFEDWLRSRYGLGPARWVVLDGTNQALTFGIAPPKGLDLVAQLERAGFQSPVRQLRAFVQGHPGHLEGRADLLKELRRRALKAAKSIKGDQDIEGDTIAWAAFANAVDITFKGDWRGLKLHFFRTDQDQPEARSPLMKAIFARHIGKVESALGEESTSETLWDTWAWMARSLENRPWKRFLSSLNPFVYPGGPTCPSPSVAVWLTREAKAVEDWESVAKLAAISQDLNSIPLEDVSQWVPGSHLTHRKKFAPLNGFPEYSSYAPRLEALLRLNRKDEAQQVYQDLILSRRSGTAVAAEAARRAGLADLAQEWATGRLTRFVPFYPPFRRGLPQIVALAEWNDPYIRRLIDLSQTLRPEPSFRALTPRDTESLGWTGNKNRWALLDGDGRLITEGMDLPKAQFLQSALDTLDLKSLADLARSFLRHNHDQPEASRVLAVETGMEAARSMDGGDLGPRLDPEIDAKLWGECARAWYTFFEDTEGWKAPRRRDGAFEGWEPSARRSPLMMDVAMRALPKVEAALEREPASHYLWSIWLFLRHVEGENRPFAPLMARLEPSPMAAPGAFPPPVVMEAWLKDCRQNGRWGQAASLLRGPWERALGQADTERKKKKDAKIDPRGWDTGLLLTEALLMDSRPSEADNVVKAWVERGGVLRDLADLVQAAKKLGLDSLAASWDKLAKSN